MYNSGIVFVLFFVSYGASITLFRSDKDGSKDSVAVSVESNPKNFVLKSAATRADNWEVQGTWRSTADYTVEQGGRTLHNNYVMNCYKPKASGSSRAAVFFGYNELLEVEVSTCDEAKLWNTVRILQPAGGYHHVSVLFKDSCKEYQANVETTLDNTSSECQRNAGASDWRKL